MGRECPLVVSGGREAVGRLRPSARRKNTATRDFRGARRVEIVTSFGRSLHWGVGAVAEARRKLSPPP